MRPEGRELVNRRPFLLVLAVAAIGTAVAVGIPEIAAAQMASGILQMRMSKPASMSHPRSGQLYMQTNEIRNVVVHYRWSASGTLTEVERVPTSGAGSGELSPIYHVNRPNDFEGDGTFRGLCGDVSSGPSDSWISPDGEYLYQIYGNASKLVGYATKPDGSLEEVTSVAIPYNSPEGLAGF